MNREKPGNDKCSHLKYSQVLKWMTKSEKCSQCEQSGLCGLPSSARGPWYSLWLWNFHNQARSHSMLVGCPRNPSSLSHARPGSPLSVQCPGAELTLGAMWFTPARLWSVDWDTMSWEKPPRQSVGNPIMTEEWGGCQRPQCLQNAAAMSPGPVAQRFNSRFSTYVTCTVASSTTRNRIHSGLQGHQTYPLETVQRWCRSGVLTRHEVDSGCNKDWWWRSWMHSR
jgi:hypothetical protein